jgi:hypothetical protein
VQCSCTSHVANLGLNHRATEKVEFDVLFHAGEVQQQPCWHQTRIDMIASLMAFSFNVPQKSSSSGGSRVHWASPGVQQTNFVPVSIGNLCGALTTKGPGCIGYLEADEYRFVIYPKGQDVVTRSPISASLDQLLSSPNSLTKRRRYFLSWTLASSYLQRGTTPWLHDIRNESIVFLEYPDDPLSMLLDNPYIRQEMTRTSRRPATDIISSLGIRLLELCFGIPLENDDISQTATRRG